MMLQKLKKAAMFGLDARIALAIFGALSIISGAALYSAIGKAKATAFLTEMREVSKALDQYYLDTGKDLPRRSSTDTVWQYYSYQTSNFVDNTENVAGWDGPYLPYELNGTFVKHSRYGNILVELMDDSDWSATAWSSCSTAGEKCYLAVSIDSVNDAALAENVDEMVDGGDGPGAGNFRWIPTDLNARYTLFVQARKNPKG